MFRYQLFLSLADRQPIASANKLVDLMSEIYYAVSSQRNGYVKDTRQGKSMTLRAALDICMSL